MNEEIVTEKSFLQIKSIRTSSNAFMMKLKEGDVIIAIDGEIVNKSYEELSKELSEIKEKKVITLFRDGVFFNTFIYGPLGVICENITYENLSNLKPCFGRGDQEYLSVEKYVLKKSVCLFNSVYSGLISNNEFSSPVSIFE